MCDPMFVDPEDGELHALDSGLWRAPSGRPLAMSPAPGMLREQIVESDPSIWRYQAALPVRIENPVSLGEGRTPLIRSEFAGVGCRFKLEWFSPTGSFKDRGASTLISFLSQHGVTEVLEDSSGNGGAAMAAYGAAAGIRVKIVVPESTPTAKVAQSIAYGAEVVRIPGSRQASEDAAIAIALAGDVFYAGHNWHPMFLQGTKTLGYELWEDLNFTAPDNVVIPASAGSNLIGCHLAFTELQRAGEIDRLPRLFISQPANCAPVHAAFQAGADDYVDVDFAPTIAEGTAIQRPVRLPEMLTAIRETSGGTVAISEEEIVLASFELAARGLYVEPTSAHAAAGFAQLVAQGTITSQQETVVILTGSGSKATAFYSENDRAK